MRGERDVGERDERGQGRRRGEGERRDERIEVHERGREKGSRDKGTEMRGQK